MEIAGLHFEINETVEPTPDAAIKPAGRVGRVESRAWTEFRGQPGYWRYTIRWPGGGTSSESAKHLQPADAIACDLKVVVSGAPIKLETTTTATVAELIEQALLKGGIATHEGAVKWELRTADGKQLTHLVGDAEPVDGETTLFLDPEVGGGGERPFDEPGHMVRQLYTTDDPEAWKGTPPAQGTRRRLILDTLEHFSHRLISGHSGRGTGGSCLDAADAIEEALLKVVDQGATPESGSPASVAMDVLDGMKIPRACGGAILTISDRVTAMADELVEVRRERVHIGNLLDMISIPRSTGATGEPGTPRTLTVLERVDILAKRYLNSKPLPPEPIHPGPATAGDVLPEDESYTDRLLRQREEARAGEDHWKSQRDAAFRLLQWVLPDLMGHPSDTLGADLADDAPDEDRK